MRFNNEQYYLAFKGTDAKLKSAWVSGQIKQQYQVGKTFVFHNNVPTYLVSETLSTDGWNLQTGCDSYIRRVILVKVKGSDIRHKLPYLSSTGEKTKKKIISLCPPDSHDAVGVGAVKIQVLEEVFPIQFDNAATAMLHFENAYRLPRVPNYQLTL